MGTLLNRRRYMGGKASLYDAEVEYVSTINNVRFTTNILKADVGFFRVVKQYVNKPSGQNGDGGYVADPRLYCAIGYVKGGLGMQWGGSNTDKMILNWDTDEHTYELDVINKTGTIDNTTVNLTINSTRTGYFEINGYYPQRVTGTKYKSAEIYDVDMVKVLDLTPVRVGQQGGFYDKVSETLMGVGSFTAGPDKTGGG